MEMFPVQNLNYGEKERPGFKSRHWSFCDDLETDSVSMNPKASGYSSS